MLIVLLLLYMMTMQHSSSIPGVSYNWGSMSWPAVVGGVVDTSRFVCNADQSVMSEWWDVAEDEHSAGSRILEVVAIVITIDGALLLVCL